MSKPIFREYIGTLRCPKVPFDEVPVDYKGEFHFVLTFASDYDPINDPPNDGKFQPQWDTSIYNQQTIKEFKKEHPNVKVVVSIGEPDKKTPFNFSERELWISNAIASLTKIIIDFRLDGIDVNYVNVAAVDFAECVGEVIRKLKEMDVIQVASIAPSDAVQIHYHTLYQNYSEYIDWVNYQFYREVNPITTPEAFLELYDALTNRYYSNEKFLPGFSTDSNDWIVLSPRVFINAIRQLKKLSGAFIWSANHSIVINPDFNFQYESLVQRILCGDDLGH